MKREWLIRSSGQIGGPWTFAEVAQAIQQRKLTAIDEVCLPGQRWRYVRQVKELQQYLNKTINPNDDLTLTDHGHRNSTELNVPKAVHVSGESNNIDQILQKNLEQAFNTKIFKNVDDQIPKDQIIERLKMQKNQKILIGLTFLTIICMVLLFVTLQKSFQSKETQEINAQRAEQMEARELAQLAIWASGNDVKKEERLEVFKKINQWRIRHQYARRELLVYEMQLAKLEMVEQSVYDRLAYEFTSVSYRQSNYQDLLLGPQPMRTCKTSQSLIENTAIKNNFSIICEMMFGDLSLVKKELPFDDELTQQNNRQLLLLLIEYYIRTDQFQSALGLLKKYQLTGTGLEETLRYQVCAQLKDALCTTSPAK